MSLIAQDAPQRNNSRSSPDEVDPILIAEWPIKRGEIARVSIKKYKGTWLLDIRKFFESESGEFNPTSKGIALSLKHLNHINAAVGDAVDVARQRGLISAVGEGEQ